MSGGHRAHPAGAVGRRRRQGPPHGRNQGKRYWVDRHTQGDAVQTRPRGWADRRAGRQRDHQRERTRPKCLGKLQSFGAENALFQGRVETCDMCDQRIETWSCLRRINPGDSGVRGRVSRETVNGLGRKRGKTARTDHRRRLGDSSRVGGDCPCQGERAGLHSRFICSYSFPRLEAGLLRLRRVPKHGRNGAAHLQSNRCFA